MKYRKWDMTTQKFVSERQIYLTYQSSGLRDGTVDGEMGVDGAHLVLVALRHALDQVLDVRADGADGGQFLLATEPFLNLLSRMKET